MNNITKETLKRAQEKNMMSVDPYKIIDSDEAIGHQQAKSYGVEFKGTYWLIDELDDTATNTITGDCCDIATFLHAYRKYTSKDNSFTSNPQLLDGDELEDIINQIKVSEYIAETVVTQSVTADNSIYYTTSKCIIFKDDNEDVYMVRQELEKKSEDGADLLAFTEPKIFLYNGLCNAMLYYTEDASSVLHFLGFKDLIGGTWYNKKMGVSAHIGEYNYFKKTKKALKVNTKKAKALDTLASL